MKLFPNVWTGVIDQLKSVIEVSNSQMAETTSDRLIRILFSEENGRNDCRKRNSGQYPTLNSPILLHFATKQPSSTK
ncbi:unnamed protein product [Allacma fusca]|uniref:Uncharacterized protein n=1 Tax=Allacma fusca TaxID=39272 RepID=A0A8J2KM78_9HEXA|nr:unnamed protein product [Allacma fusca]